MVSMCNLCYENEGKWRHHAAFRVFWCDACFLRSCDVSQEGLAKWRQQVERKRKVARVGYGLDRRVRDHALWQLNTLGLGWLGYSHKGIWDYEMAYGLLVRFGGFHCRKCGAGGPVHIDHVVSRVAGGSDDLTNLQILCEHCNLAKGSKSVDYRSEYEQERLGDLWPSICYWLEGFRRARSGVPKL
jgi:5-methylcytosine-specific restriction endonuclease McrA